MGRKRASTKKRQIRVVDETISVPAARSKTGSLIIVGGKEDREGEMAILSEVVRRSNGKPIVIATVASGLPEELFGDYQRAFTKLGVKDLRHLHLARPEEARDEDQLALFEGAETVFFTGGDQLKITTRLGGTRVADRIYSIFRNGGTIAGTSAGASVMGDLMLIGGENRESHKVGASLMAPGLGLVTNMIIDQHFAQRGRIGRLMGAVALNPGILGVGIDENTAMIVEGTKVSILGENAVYVVDGRSVTYTNISEASAEKTMSMHSAKVHVLSDGDRFDLVTRSPIAGESFEVLKSS